MQPEQPPQRQSPVRLRSGQTRRYQRYQKPMLKARQARGLVRGLALVYG
ncbi:hypothetical protein BN126_356 [Cronobacter sakazakii 680]|nr:hypothetical protein BN126_356 [Cronobacter sakazakii 680]